MFLAKDNQHFHIHPKPQVGPVSQSGVRKLVHLSTGRPWEAQAVEGEDEGVYE